MCKYQLQYALEQGGGQGYPPSPQSKLQESLYSPPFILGSASLDSTSHRLCSTAAGIYGKICCCCCQPFPSPGDLPNPGLEPAAPAWQMDSLPFRHQGRPYRKISVYNRPVKSKSMYFKGQLYFLKIFFSFIWTIIFKKSLLNLLQYFFCFLFFCFFFFCHEACRISAP